VGAGGQGDHLPAGRPEAKGLIERSHDYLERSFVPGRTFASPADFNAQLSDWLALVNTRPRRALGCAPTDRIGADRAAMLGLPPVARRSGVGTRSRKALDASPFVAATKAQAAMDPGVVALVASEICARTSGSISRATLAVPITGNARSQECGTIVAHSPAPTSAQSEATESVST
jgi:hypothetical protein